MPKRKGRKKKKKTSKKNSFKNNNLGVSFKLQGNKLLFKTNRTEKEQEDLNKRIIEAKPKILENINVSVDRIIDIFTNYNRHILLGSLFVHSYVKQNDPSDDGKSERLLEYGHSFALAIESPINENVPSR